MAGTPALALCLSGGLASPLVALLLVVSPATQICINAVGLCLHQRPRRQGLFAARLDGLWRPLGPSVKDDVPTPRPPPQAGRGLLRARPAAPWPFDARPAPGGPGWPATPDAASPATASAQRPCGLFYAPFPSLCRHRWRSAERHVSRVGTGGMRPRPSPARAAAAPPQQGVRRASTKAVGPRRNAWVPGGTRRALAGGVRRLTAARDARGGLPSGTGEAGWPAPRADGLSPGPSIKHMRDLALHRWPPVGGRDRGGPQGTPSAQSTTLESNMSLVRRLPRYYEAVRLPAPVHHGRAPWVHRADLAILRQARCRASRVAHQAVRATLLPLPAAQSRASPAVLRGVSRVATSVPMEPTVRPCARPPHLGRRPRIVPRAPWRGATPTPAALCGRWRVPTAGRARPTVRAHPGPRPGARCHRASWSRHRGLARRRVSRAASSVGRRSWRPVRGAARSVWRRPLGPATRGGAAVCLPLRGWRRPRRARSACGWMAGRGRGGGRSTVAPWARARASTASGGAHWPVARAHARTCRGCTTPTGRPAVATALVTARSRPPVAARTIRGGDGPARSAMAQGTLALGLRHLQAHNAWHLTHEARLSARPCRDGRPGTTQRSGLGESRT